MTRAGCAPRRQGWGPARNSSQRGNESGASIRFATPSHDSGELTCCAGTDRNCCPGVGDENDCCDCACDTNKVAGTHPPVGPSCNACVSCADFWGCLEPCRHDSCKLLFDCLSGHL